MKVRENIRVWEKMNVWENVKVCENVQVWKREKKRKFLKREVRKIPSSAALQTRAERRETFQVQAAQNESTREQSNSPHDAWWL